MLPFTRAQFLDVFAQYNLGVWPAQIAAYAMGVCMVILLLRPSRRASRVTGAGLAAMWIWTGVAYHGLFFSHINKAALAFGALFVLQGLLLFHAAAIRGQLRFGIPVGSVSWAGWALLLYAVVLYPLAGLWAGHRYPELPMFGITPCPLTLFTFGLLLLTVAPVPRSLLVIPFLWSLVGGSAALLLGIPQDWPLLFSGVAIPMLLLRDRARRRSGLAT
jgi:hypothetical protein